MIVIVVVPEPVISEVTSNCSTCVSSALYKVIFPLSASTASENVITKFEVVATDGASSTGLNVSTVGAVSSITTLYHDK